MDNKPIVSQDDDGSIDTFGIEEMLVLMNHLSLTVKAYEIIIRKIASMTEPTSVHKSRSGAAVVKTLHKVLEEGLTNLFDEQMVVRRKTGEITRNGKGIQNLIVGLGDLVAYAKHNPQEAAMIKERALRMSKYESMVLGDTVSAETPMDTTDFATPDEIREHAKEARQEAALRKIDATLNPDKYKNTNRPEDGFGNLESN